MKKVSKTELEKILADHALWLNDRGTGERAELSSANLRRADLSSADLSSANLRSADLSSANLRFANLSSANLRRADLSSADLSSANLRRADLSSANLSSADLSSADLRFANLRSANLRSANLRRADLSSADLRFAATGGGEPGIGIDPKIFGNIKPDPDLLTKIAESALTKGALNMDDWHKCESTHCLAGWAVHHSGAAGYELEAATSPSVAGALLAPDIAHLFYSTESEAREWAESHLEKREAK